MPLLSTAEALHVSDSFLSSLYGDVIFRRWKELKDEMKFLTEREYVSWLIDVANHYRNEDESQLLSHETDTNQFAAYNVKSEEGLDHYNQGQGQSYETPVSEYSHLSSIQAERSSKNYSEQFILDTKVEGAGNSYEQTSMTSQVDDYEQSYYDDVGEDERMLEMERNQEIILSSDEEQINGPLEHENEPSAAPYSDGTSRPNSRSSMTQSEFGESHEKRHKCPSCSHSSVSRRAIKQHILEVHQKHKPIRCQYCHYCCSRHNTLQSHLIFKHGYTSKYCCENCRKYFPTPYLLQKHISICVL